MNGTGLEVHGTPVPGHKHDFRYTDHGPFSSWSKCKECGAVHITHYSPDGYIGNEPNEIIYEPGCCWFKTDKTLTSGRDCKDILR